jgi:hypothetical protein
MLPGGLLVQGARLQMHGRERWRPAAQQNSACRIVGVPTRHVRALPCSAQLVGDWADGHFTYGRWVYKDGSMFMGSFVESKPTAGSYFYSGSSLVQEGHFTKEGRWIGHRDPQIGKVSSVGRMPISVMRSALPPVLLTSACKHPSHRCMRAH